jgi:hypothetical protein
VASAGLTGALVVLGAAILGVIYGRGPRRAFWLGFAIFGWGYLILGFGPWFHLEIQPHLLTTRLFNELFLKLGPPPTPARGTAPLFEDMDLYWYHYRQYDASVLWDRHLVAFLRTGHALTSRIAGLFGGWLACGFRARAERMSDEPS